MPANQFKSLKPLGHVLPYCPKNSNNGSSNDNDNEDDDRNESKSKQSNKLRSGTFSNV